MLIYYGTWVKVPVGFPKEVSKHDWLMASAVVLWILRCLCTKLTFLGCSQPLTECGKDIMARSLLWLESLAWEPPSVSSNCLQTTLQPETFLSLHLHHRVSSTLVSDIFHLLWLPPHFPSQAFLPMISYMSIHRDVFLEYLHKLLPHAWIIEVFSFVRWWLKLKEYIQEWKF